MLCRCWRKARQWRPLACCLRRQAQTATTRALSSARHLSPCTTWTVHETLGTRCPGAGGGSQQPLIPRARADQASAVPQRTWPPLRCPERPRFRGPVPENGLRGILPVGPRLHTSTPLSTPRQKRIKGFGGGSHQPDLWTLNRGVGGGCSLAPSPLSPCRFALPTNTFDGLAFPTLQANLGSSVSRISFVSVTSSAGSSFRTRPCLCCLPSIPCCPPPSTVRARRRSFLRQQTLAMPPFPSRAVATRARRRPGATDHRRPLCYHPPSRCDSRRIRAASCTQAWRLCLPIGASPFAVPVQAGHRPLFHAARLHANLHIASRSHAQRCEAAKLSNAAPTCPCSFSNVRRFLPCLCRCSDVAHHPALFDRPAVILSQCLHI